MKKQLLTAVAVLASLCGYAQTQGTNTLGLGVSVREEKFEYRDGNGISSSTTNQNNFGLNYGHFFKDNQKLSIDLNYSSYEAYLSGPVNSTKINGLGGSIGYQRYFPLLQSFYAYAGGAAGYLHSWNRTDNTPSQTDNSVRGNDYFLSANGGLAWFFSKRFAIEANLISLSANYSYRTTEVTNTQSFNRQKDTSTTFNLSSQGAINNLGFRIYFLF